MFTIDLMETSPSANAWILCCEVVRAIAGGEGQAAANDKGSMSGKTNRRSRDETIHTVVMARFHIKPDGSATVELTQPAPNPRVNQLILNTLKTWRFFPAIQAGKPVASVQDFVR